ncbi:nucleotidyltransferase family protein [Ensifer adhaerens]|uniref:nucleotidyltransferase family protein n=1 Tax=Ensifer adhaerens TaxID=106592 RepID=UPI00098EC4F9|nr:nucleotidyltransferase family protein [Ensifer adhaerens]
MRRHNYRNLVALASCLKGKPPDGVNWDDIIALANESLTVSSLALVVRTAPDMPQDVRDYLTLIYERNAERNRRLLAQLTEAVGHLNRIGIEPVVMKGAAILLAQELDDIGARILTDLDIFVRPADMSSAITALEGIGYELRLGSGSWPGNPRYHLPAVLERPVDVGGIDLHCRPKGPVSFGDIEWLYGHSRRVILAGNHAYLPSAFVQIVFLILHDQFQDGDYWRGLIDLRHLLDIAKLAHLGNVDWGELRSLFAAGYERNAVDTQILTALELFGMDSGSKLSFGTRARIQLMRRQVQFGRNYLASPLTILTLLTEVPHYRHWDRFGGEPYPSLRREVVRKVRELRRIFRSKPVGKL